MDAVDVPHDRIKQLYGLSLPVIGLEVHGNELRITMPPLAKQELVDAIDLFCSSSSRTLRQCQALAGYVNWALNVYPKLRPGLALLYAKIGGEFHPHRSISLNAQVRRDLLWLAKRIRSSDGVFLLESIAWRMDEADITIESDACLTGFGFWCRELNKGFYAGTLSNISPTHNFFHEAYAVVCAFHWVCSEGIEGLRRVIIKSDNTNTVDIFNSLKAHSIYSDLLKFAVELLMTFDVELRVVHVPGDVNLVADALSRFQFDEVGGLQPSLVVSQYQPPAVMAGPQY